MLALLIRQDRLQKLEASIAEDRVVREQAQLRYRHGKGDMLLVLQTDRRILNTKSQILTLQRLLLDTRIDLHLALGGGFDASAPAGDPEALLPPTLAEEHLN